MLKNHGEVWLNRNGIANILLLSCVQEKFKVEYSSTGGNKFVLTKQNDIVEFVQIPDGLFYLDTNSTKPVTLMVDTVENKSEGFTRRDQERARIARQAMTMMGNLSETDFKKMVC